MKRGNYRKRGFWVHLTRVGDPLRYAGQWQDKIRAAFSPTRDSGTSSRRVWSKTMAAQSVLIIELHGISN